MIKISKKILLFVLISQLALYSCKNNDKSVNEETKEQVEIPKKEETEENKNIVKLNESELKNSGLKTVNAEKMILPDYLRTSGEIEENENFITHINSKFTGRVSNVYKSVGDYAVKGEIIATIESKDIAILQSELLETYSKITFAKNEIANKTKITASSIAQQQKYIDFLDQNYKRQKKLFEDDIAPRKNVEEADKNLKTSILEKERIKLEGSLEVQKIQGEINNLNLQVERITKEFQLLNFNSGDINQLLKTRKLKTSVPIISPVNGLISNRHISPGEMVDTENDIFTITNPGSIWVYANVYEKDISKIKVNQKGFLTTKSYPGIKYALTVNYVLPQVENETRTSKVRLAVKNNSPKGAPVFEYKNNQPVLRKGMFADVFIDIGGGSSSLFVPKEAIQRDNEQPVIYVVENTDTFQIRNVETGRTVDKYTEITKGLKAGEKVVTKGSFTLKSISRKGEMGEE